MSMAAIEEALVGEDCGGGGGAVTMSGVGAVSVNSLRALPGVAVHDVGRRGLASVGGHRGHLRRRQDDQRRHAESKAHYD